MMIAGGTDLAQQLRRAERLKGGAAPEKGAAPRDTAHREALRQAEHGVGGANDALLAPAREDHGGGSCD